MCVIVCECVCVCVLVFRQQRQSGLGRRWRAGLCVRLGLRAFPARAHLQSWTPPVQAAEHNADRPHPSRRRRSRRRATASQEPRGNSPLPASLPPSLHPASEKDARRERRTSKHILRLPLDVFRGTVADFSECFCWFAASIGAGVQPVCVCVP